MPKVRDAIRLVERDGWRLARTRGEAIGSTVIPIGQGPFQLRAE